MPAPSTGSSASCWASRWSDLVTPDRLPLTLEIVGFSEEEGVRFGVPFIGSRALVGAADASLLDRTDANGVTVSQAIRDFGLDPAQVGDAVVRDHPMGYLEFHIEQGPVLDKLGLALGVVEAIVGQTRGDMRFTGTAGHAGATPMSARRDAVAAAAEWIVDVERLARLTPGLVATVGRVDPWPGATNVIAGSCVCSLDVRNAVDHLRLEGVAQLVESAERIATERGLSADWDTARQPAGSLDGRVVRAGARAGGRARRACRAPDVERRRARRHDHGRLDAGGDALPSQPRRHQPPP